MKSSIIYLNLFLVILASCEKSGSTEKSSESEETDNFSGESEDIEKKDDEILKIIEADPKALKNGDLPILPPLILLDFGNDVDNDTLSSEDKFKRTIEQNLGYGFARNNLFSGKYNYYFPAGKTGTSVSIEESISPFQPKTIIETVKPQDKGPYGGTEKYRFGDKPSRAHQGGQGAQEANPFTSQILRLNSQGAQDSRVYGGQPPRIDAQQALQEANLFGTAEKNPFGAQISRLNSQGSTPNRFSSSQPIFGQRTKLYKSSQIEFTSERNPYVMEKPNYSTTTLAPRLVTSAPNFANPAPNYATVAPPNSFVTPTSYQTIYGGGQRAPKPTFDLASNLNGAPQKLVPNSAMESPLSAFANLPRYTIENGVRYENKIVWKYPDGKISQTPPSSYVNAYNEFIARQKQATEPYYQNTDYKVQSEQTESHQSLNGQSYQNFNQDGNYQGTFAQAPNPPQTFGNFQPMRFSFGNVNSKSPAQFPSDQNNRPSRPSQFVSSATLNSAPAPNDANFQNSSPGKVLKDSYGSTTYLDQSPVSKYAVNSPNAEYIYEDRPKNGAHNSARPASSSGKISDKTLSKYSPEAQKYLTKIFGAGTASKVQTPNFESSSSSASISGTSNFGASNVDAPNFGAKNYENLLSYNPSLSQYIKDPSAILRAQPTFVQAGNSLIPVIILRVDGVAPIRARQAPNINLKALLQQYLTDYAGSIAAGYDDAETSDKPISGARNPVYELTQLAQSLSRFSPNPTIANELVKQLSANLEQNSFSATYGTSKNSPRQKIKNVEIIEDPRYTSYKVNN